MHRKHYDVIVVGSGVAGISALIWLKQLGVQAIMMEKSDAIGGQLHKVHNKIVDYPGLFGIDGKELQERMYDHLVAMNCEWITKIEVLTVEVADEVITLSTLNYACMRYEVYTTNYVIMATGAHERRLGIPGEDNLLSTMGVLSTAKKTEMFRGKRVVIVGGGNRALEGAYRLMNVARSITIVHRSDRFTAKAEYLHPLLQAKDVTFKVFSKLKSIVWDTQLKGVIVTNNHTRADEYQKADYVLIRIGIEKEMALIEHLVESENGHVKTNRQGKTSIHQIYAIGDMATPAEYSSISVYAGQGMAAAKSIWLSMEKNKKKAEPEKSLQKAMEI